MWARVIFRVNGRMDQPQQTGMHDDDASDTETLVNSRSPL